VVYRAQHEHLHRRVALKLLAPELARDERFRNRFVRESRLAASLEHPNIIPIYDAGEAKGLLYIAMRYVEGCTLGDFLERYGRLAPPVALFVIGQIAEALDVAHAAGLVHRDVKPENIMVTEEDGELGRIFLSDFGLTKRPNIPGTTRSGELMGTVGYVAPEQIEGKTVDSRSDIYSLGCVMYQCFTGCRPFDLDTDVAILWGHLNQPVPRITDRRPDLPKALDEVVAKAMAKAPQERYRTAGALASAARAGMLRETVDAPAPSRGPTTVQRRSLLWVSLLAITMIGIATLAVWMLAIWEPAQSSHSNLGGLGAIMPTDPLNRSPNASDYRNPLLAYNLPDPTIIAAGTKFYAYTTQTVYEHQIHIPVLASRDLIDWRYVGDALQKLPAWANRVDADTWAPDIVKVQGHYNLYFAERLKGGASMGIALATSSSPIGPFRVVGDPLMHHRGYTDIDPFVFRDAEGRLLMYWGSAGAPIRVQQLSSDGTTLVGDARAVLAPSSGTGYEGLVEGPSLIRHTGFYYLFYSGNRCCGRKAHYAVLVARSRSPMGPFARSATNPIIAANDYFNAPGHGTVFQDKSGADFILYHAMERSDANFARYLMLDRIRWRSGWPVVNGGNGPSRTPQPRPEIGIQ
jgi:serine/threonine protein kinase